MSRDRLSPPYCESVQLSLGEINNEYRITVNFDNREICVNFQNECVPSS